MAIRAFYSFHYDADAWRAAQVRNIGVVEGNEPATDNDWEAIRGRGGAAIQNWIDRQLQGRNCTIVLVGWKTATRKWVKYEIEKSWNDGKKVLGVRIHRLLDQSGFATYPGENPFYQVQLQSGHRLSAYVALHDPAGDNSKEVYASIARNLGGWISNAASLT